MADHGWLTAQVANRGSSLVRHALSTDARLRGSDRVPRCRARLTGIFVASTCIGGGGGTTVHGGMACGKFSIVNAPIFLMQQCIRRWERHCSMRYQDGEMINRVALGNR